MIKIKDFAIAALAVGVCACSPKTDDPQARMDSFIDSLMSEMTLEEKICQLNLPAGDDIVTGDVLDESAGTAQLAASGQIGGTFNIKSPEKIRRLQELAVTQSPHGIPLLIGMDVIHGYETVFPIPLALASSWDMEAIERSARIAAVEASAAGINWTFSPMVDISRDPRWGRMAEGAGEDPYLGSEVARAMVRGYQGDLSDSTEILACVKHFALYGGSEAGRDYNTVDMSHNRMYNEYFAPYRAAVDEGAATVMTSFNLVDGVPATANKWLIDDVLRNQWGFDGVVVTDYGSIGEMKNHGVAELPEASVQALKAGTDMDMCSFGFIGTLKDAVDDGSVSEADIDRAVRRILEAKYRLGLFDNPYKYNDLDRPEKDIYNDGHRAEARRIAAETFVLLKNEGGVLPLEKKGRIALVGPLADNVRNMPGMWSVAANPYKYKSLLQAFRDAVGDKATVVYAKGANFYSDAETESHADLYGNSRDSRSDEQLLREALAAAAGADVIVAAVGEASDASGESACRTSLTLPENQRRLLEALKATGKPVVMLNYSGRPTVMEWENENMPAILNVWFGGSEGPDAITDVVFGDVNPSGKLTATFPRSVGQIPIYYNHLQTGRPLGNGQDTFSKYRTCYIDSPNSPLYPFGYGLSYTTFEYGDLTLDSDTLTDDGAITASVTVTNTGDRAGSEVVQFYTRDMLASIARPVKELKHFERVTLEPGESTTVSFRITPETLKFYNRDLDYVAEPGDFLVMAGPDSERTQSLPFTLK